MLVSEEYINATEGWGIGSSDPYEPWTDNVGQLFRAFQKEYGRCVSPVYIDREGGGTPVKVGWVFQKVREYDDSPETYIAETWVTLHDAPDTVTRKAHFHAL